MLTARLLGPMPVTERVFPLDSAETFAGLYAETHGIVFRYVYGLHGGPQQDVEDLTAETYVRAWQARRRFQGDQTAALRWLLQIARRLVIDVHRRRQRRGETDPIEVASIPTADSGPEEEALQSEQRRILVGLLSTLSDRQRDILVLRYLLGWPVKDIADYLTMAPNTVSVTIRRALEHLRQAWPEPAQGQPFSALATPAERTLNRG